MATNNLNMLYTQYRINDKQEGLRYKGDQIRTIKKRQAEILELMRRTN